MKLLPNVAAYKMELPDAESLAKHLAKVKHEPLTPSMAYGSGFVEIETHDELVVTFNGGYAFALQYDEKIIPSSVVNAELKLRVADFKEREGFTPGRKMQKEMRENVVAELCAKALVRSKIITCMYSVADQLLLVPTIGAKLRAAVTSQLVRAVESIRSTTIYVSTAKGSLTSRLTDYLVEANDLPFDSFDVGGKVVLVSKNGKTTFALDDLQQSVDGAMEAIKNGSNVVEIALSSGPVNFRLSQDFLLKGIKFGEIPDAQDYSNDAQAEFEYEAATQTLMLCRVVNDLCEMFAYKPQLPDGDYQDDLM